MIGLFDAAIKDVKRMCRAIKKWLNIKMAWSCELIRMEGKIITRNSKKYLQVGNNEFDLSESVDLEGSKITKLPNDLKVGGYLDLRGTKITKLPNDLKVGGYLDLRGTKITKLPAGLKVGDNLWLGGTKITQVPKHLQAKVVR